MTMIRDTEIVDTAVAEPEGDNHARHTNASDIDTVRSPRRSMSRIGLAVAGATLLACSVLVSVTVVTDDPTPAATTPASSARPRTPDTIEHWTIANTPRPRTPDTIEHRTIANTPRPRTPDTIEHRTIANTPRPRTPDTIEHRIIANTPRPRTPDTIEHRTIANTPRPRTPDTIEHWAAPLPRMLGGRVVNPR